MTSTATRPARPAELLDATAGVGAEDRQLQDAVAHFARQRLRPGIAEWFEAGRSPAELAHEFGDLGVLGMHLKGYGCAGASATSYGLACLELEAADSAFRSFVSVQGPCPCSRSGPTARRSRSRSGCPGWRPGGRSAASG